MKAGLPWLAFMGLVELLAVVCATSAVAATLQYEYDALGRLFVVVHQDGSAFEYDYDEVGNRVRILRGNASTGVGTGETELADLDGNGIADLADLAVLRGAYKKLAGEPCYLAECDLNGDGRIDEIDVRTWFLLSGQPTLPGDWAGAPTGHTQDLVRIAPDAKADFYDLCFLAAHWRHEPDSRFKAAGKALQRQLDARTALGKDDLAMLAASWGSGSGPVGAICLAAGEFIPAGLGVLPAHGAPISVRVAMGEADFRTGRQVQVVLGSPPSGQLVFQFTLSKEGGWSTSGIAGGSEAADLPGAVPGSGEAPQGLTGGLEFFRVRIEGEQCTVAGALFGAAGSTAEADLVLCSLPIPSLPSRQRFALSGGALGTSAGSLFRLADWEGDLDLIPLPAAPELTNYPNPFNPSTEIRYAVPSQGEVSLGVYDVRGRRVRLLREGPIAPGWYVEQWDGRDDRGHEAASGVYFVRLNLGTEHLSRRATLLR